MVKRDKIIQGILNNARNVRFEDAISIAESLGFTKRGGKGLHCTLAKIVEPIALNFQNRKGTIPAYQARQLAAMIRKHGLQQ